MGCNSSKNSSKAFRKRKILPIMSFLPSNNANQDPKNQLSATKGLASSFGFKKPTQMNKVRPISAPPKSLEKSENCTSKMLPKPTLISMEKCVKSIPKSKIPSPNRFGFCKPISKLEQPTIRVTTKKVDVERRSQSEPQKREIPKRISSGSKIAISKVTSSHLPKPQIPVVKYQVTKSPDKHAKTAENMRLKNEAIKKIHQGVTLRKLSDSVEFTEVISINRPSRLTINSNARGSLIRERTNKYLRQVSSSSSKQMTSSDSDSDSSSYEEKHDNEVFIKEKTELFERKDTTCSDEEYGPGEALAVEEFTEIKDKINVIDNKFANVDMSVSLRDVLLNIEDTTFATLAAMSSTIRIEDETSPDDECLSPTESETAEFPHSKTESTNIEKRDTMSPILRCNISKSGSFSSDTRDFFDDEIADQPALMFSGPPSESCNVEDIDDALFRLGSHSSNNKKSKLLRRSLSADGSLSESLNSDDLMLDDYDPVDDKFVEPDNEKLLKTLENTKQNTFNEWSSLTSPKNSNSSLKDDIAPVKDETDSKDNNGEVIMSFDRFREVTDDIASIKNMLFELNRALIEDKQDATYPEEQEVHCYYEDQLLDLKQQIAYMAQQMEQKDRTIQILNEQIAQRPRPLITMMETQNAATQTDRCRSTTAPTLCTFDREGQTNGRPIIRCSDMTERSKSVSGNRIRIGMLKHKFLMDAGRTLPNV